MIIQHLFSSGFAMMSTLCYSAGALWPLPASLPRTAPGPGMPWSSDTTGVTWAAHGLRYEFPEFPVGLILLVLVTSAWSEPEFLISISNTFH
jgi:hypothetical protein